MNLKRIIELMGEEDGDHRGIPVENIIEMCEIVGVEDCEEKIDRMIQYGELYHPDTDEETVRVT